MNNVEVLEGIEQILKSPIWAELAKLNGTPQHTARPIPPLVTGSLYLVVSSPTYKPLGKQKPRPMAKRWHWSLYCYANYGEGQLCHIKRASDSDNQKALGVTATQPVLEPGVASIGGPEQSAAKTWSFESCHVDNLLVSMPVVCAVRISETDGELQQEFLKRVAQVPLVPAISGTGFDGNDIIDGGISSCSWILKALYDLNQEGWISIKPSSSVEAIYNEVVDLCVHAEQIDAPLIQDSQFVCL
ncbi:hypothetical protein BROUX41_000224 [Berkeleyomyces rouxiae]|uniref:uncharacterized protein n=1 Tax=Berkeleyomyces rouxiae TaxID=2035830 RepID=UPI003B81F454